MNIICKLKQFSTLALLFSYVATASAQDAQDVLSRTWDYHIKKADGDVVNFYMWGGSDTINNYINWVTKKAKKDYNLTIRRIGINDTSEAVNTILQEYEAGVTKEGSVDLVWVNGENFHSLKQANLLFCGYLELMPNNALIDWRNPSIAYDFGTAVDGCEVPWNKTQFAIGYNSAKVANPPTSIDELFKWIKKNPGRFTYPAPPDFTGSGFVKHVFYYAAGGHEKLMGEFNQKSFDRVATKTWDLLNSIEKYLWREGKTYPKDITALSQLYSNQEVYFHLSYDAATFGTGVDNGSYPETTRSFGFKRGTIGNTNYVAIPINSPNKSAAMVVANLLLSEQAQLEKAKKEVWGAGTSLDLRRLSGNGRESFINLPAHPSVIAATELEKISLPELGAKWVTAIEKNWQENVAKK